MTASEPLRITIHLEEAPAPETPFVLHCGEPIRGLVEVEVLEDVSFQSFQVGFQWHTEGKGNKDQGREGETLKLARDEEWSRGTTRQFPFNLRAPWGPLSYSGKILKVRWELEARMERSLLRGDVREALPLELVPVPEMGEVNLGPVPQKKESLEAEKKGYAGVWLFLGVACLVGAVVVGAVNGWEFSDPVRWVVFSLIVGGLLLTLRGFWRRLGKGKLGEPTVKLSTTELRRGEEIRFGVVVRPENRTEIRSLEVVLECEERVVHGHGQYQSHHRRQVYERTMILAERKMVEVQRGLRRKGSLTIPTDAPVTFGAPSNQLIWWLRFRGDVVGWPDWKEPFLLTVRP
jgi:hypothetical protein